MELTPGASGLLNQVYISTTTSKRLEVKFPKWADIKNLKHAYPEQSSKCKKWYDEKE